MTKKLQVLWYLKKDDFINYAIDFKPFNDNKKIEGYEISELDEDLIYDLMDKNPEELELLGFFQSESELKKYLKENIESEDDLLTYYENINWTGEDYYISYGPEKLGSNKILNWYDALKEEYSKSLGIWIQWITGYDTYDLKCGGKVLTYVLADIFNLPESYFNELIPDKGMISIQEWNRVIERMEKKYHLELGLKKSI
ncbi:hypothetical protein [Methanobrevibacter sp. DSM 116169]|uniref:hypothetical protein n=1 Tax=Methanobrevibacter sp. DSM 116169 TaxID=3242727 RepID=UPI0038FCED66